MTIKSTAHMKAVSDLLEIVSIVSTLALGIDGIWAVRDGMVGGFNCGLGVITFMLMFCFCIASVAVVKYHYKQYNVHLREAVKIKLKHCKQLAKHK